MDWVLPAFLHLRNNDITSCGHIRAHKEEEHERLHDKRLGLVLLPPRVQQIHRGVACKMIILFMQAEKLPYSTGSQVVKGGHQWRFSALGLVLGTLCPC